MLHLFSSVLLPTQSYKNPSQLTKIAQTIVQLGTVPKQTMSENFSTLSNDAFL
jgi:hypothetical protein